MFECNIHKIPLASPSDTEGLQNLIEQGTVNPDEILGMIFTPEGDDLAGVQITLAYSVFLSEQLGISRKAVLKKIPLIACRGLTGLMVPHVAVLTRKEILGEETDKKRLIIATATTRTLLPEEIGTTTHIQAITQVIKDLMVEAGIADEKDVRLVWVKSHWGTFRPTYGRLDLAIADAATRNKQLITENYQELGARVRSCAALGAGIALGDINETTVNNTNINENYDTIYTLRALTSAGNEHPEPTCQIILFGNSTKSASNAIIGNGLMQDALDTSGLKDALRDAGLVFDCCPPSTEQQKIIYTLIGSGLHASNTIRGHRHTVGSPSMFSQYNWTIQKAPSHAVVASVIGSPIIEVCSSVEHTHPPNGLPVFVIAEKLD